MKRVLGGILILVFMFSSGCSINIFNTRKWEYNEAKISRHALPTPYIYGGYTGKMPQYIVAENNSLKVDLRHSDLREEDLSDDKINLEHALFDNKTLWPENLPDFFDPRRIMKTAKNPGLNISKLHDEGINGKNVSIAFLGYPLFVDHADYVDRVRLYEEIDIGALSASEFSSKYVSIAAGKSRGIAPEADIFYTAALCGSWSDKFVFIPEFKYYTKAVDRIIEINKTLPKSRRIRAVHISYFHDNKAAGFEEFAKALERLKTEGIFVVMQGYPDIKIAGLGRDPMKDPDKISSYGIPHIMDDNWDEIISGKQNYNYGEDVILLPSDSIYAASPSDAMDYAFYSMAIGGEQEAYMMGLYALACQVYPDITPEIFMKEALSTGEKLEVERNGKKVVLGKIVNTEKLFENIRKMVK